VEQERPNPDELLKQVEKEERKTHRGKLKIFFGYSAGVGKTYAMLEDAHHRLSQGLDVVVACVESHGRMDTEILLRGIESIPEREIEYRGMLLREPDLDAILARRPQLVLVDELAHSNAPDSRHAKRYQDVQELLEAGIDVYTTLNVQHLDSMNDTISQITGVKVKETVPDSVLDEADELKIVDLPPEELMQRFREGKIYVPSQAAIAAENFFNEGNLIALRELTFRRAAEHIDEQMLEYMRTRSIPGPWPVSEKLLVCIGNSKTLNERLIRTGRRLADELKSDWHAIYVETPAGIRLSGRNKMEAMRALDVAAKAGAKTSTSFGVSIADEVVRFAKKNNVTRVVVGRPLKPRWQEVLFGSVANQILSLSGPIEIIVISGAERTEKESPERETQPQPRVFLTRLFYCLWLVLGLTIVAMIAKSYISSTNLVMLYLIGVVLAAISWGLWPAIFTASASVVTYDYFFVPPSFNFRITDSEYLITFGAFLFVGVVISLLVVRSKEYASAAQRREDHTSILYALSIDLAAVNDIQAAFETVGGHVRKACSCSSAFFLPLNGLLTVSLASAGLDLDEKEMTAANWTFVHGIRSGKDTDTLASATLRYYPLRTPNGIVGVMGIQPVEQEGIIKMEQERLIDAFASQTALAVERIEFWKQICDKGKI
jgi:two-component system sensor histidine kinase KdpD